MINITLLGGGGNRGRMLIFIFHSGGLIRIRRGLNRGNTVPHTFYTLHYPFPEIREFEISMFGYLDQNTGINQAKLA